MSHYPIKRWDAVMFGNSITKAPMIYIEPDETFLNFVRENKYAVLCEVSGTGTVYDGKKIPGTVDRSAVVPNCRPNYYAATGYYVVTLHADWLGYPENGKLGHAKFFGMKAPLEKPPVPPPKPRKRVPPAQTASHNSNAGSDTGQSNRAIILSVVGSALVMGLILFFVSRVIKK